MDLKDRLVSAIKCPYYIWAVALALRPSEIVSTRIANIDFQPE